MSNASQSNRAELVRRRRLQQAEKRVARSSALAARPVAAITSRSVEPYGVPLPVRSPSHRRQYQTALSMPGIEVNMPAIRFTSTRLKWRVLSLTLSLMLGAVLYLAWTSPIFLVDNPQVSGDERIGSDEIRAVLGVKGEPVFLLVPSELENRLRLNYPEMESARVTVGLPNTVEVRVVERTPLISWQQGNGYTWIDDKGVAFRPRGTAANAIMVSARAAPPPGVPSLQDPLSPIPYASADIVQAVQMLAPSAPQGAMLLYDPRYGLGWSDSRGWQVFFGSDARDMPVKLQVYQALVKSLEAKGIVPVFISVQYANAPYYRMSQ